MAKSWPYRIIGALDTETTNIGSSIEGYKAFPVLYQLATIEDINTITVDSADSIEVEFFRHASGLYERLDRLLSSIEGYTGVILVHNLSFDMYALAPWLNTKSCKVLAKTARKPITISILDENDKPQLIFLDTLGLYMKSLARLGEECGMPKAVGDWDYSKIRTPETLLSDEELHYARRDLETLLVYTAHFLRKNPDILESDIGSKVVTKTGVVRAKRMKHLGGLKGRGLPKTVNQMWNFHNRGQSPKSDEELFSMHAATRGGFTFCAHSHASKVFVASDEMTIAAYDATSQHPAQMVSHLYPIDFTSATMGELEQAIKMVAYVTPSRILEKWSKPFPCAFNALFAFENLRPKLGSWYSTHGIYPLASARLSRQLDDMDNQSQQEFRNVTAMLGYSDSADNPRIYFGKLESAEYCELWLTELGLWEVIQAYDFDSIRPLGGYLSLNFRKPTDLSILSVMRFYKAKSSLKESMHDGQFERLRGLFPDSLVDKAIKGEATEDELHDYYMLSKSDLNALFGIEATNEYRRDFELSEVGIILTGEDGLCNAPKNPKCWYQFGQRIVGWSRIAQHVAIGIAERHSDAVICGDTDSFKIYIAREKLSIIDRDLLDMGAAIDKARADVTSRIRQRYADQYVDMPGLGHYVSEGEYDGFSASWNKSYLTYSAGKVKATIAGVPTARGEHSINSFCDDLIREGVPFEDIASAVIGYNVTFDYSLTKLNGRKHPIWGDYFDSVVTDYLGNSAHVHEPMALAIYPEPKTIGNTESGENAANLSAALKNNELVNYAPITLAHRDGKGVIEYG